MLSRFTQFFMALLMAVPMCWCCVSQAKEAETSCTACHKFLLPEDRPTQQPAHHSDMPCCQGTLERNLSPDTTATPRLVLVDLQPWLWQRAEENFLPKLSIQLSLSQLIQNHGPPRIEAPFYVQHCALLL
jgi:hypothetical protein